MLHGQRETSWQVPYLAPAAEWLTWSGVRGVTVVTHTQIPGYAMTYMAAPCRIPPGSSSQAAAEKNLTDFWVMKQGGNQGIKNPRNITMGSVQCCCPCTSGSLSEAVKAGRLSRILVPWSRQKCELINDSAFKTWIDSHTPTHYFTAILLLPSQAPHFEWWKEISSRDIFHIFLCGLKNACPEMTDEILLSRFKIPSNISPASTVPRVEHLNIQG